MDKSVELESNLRNFFTEIRLTPYYNTFLESNDYKFDHCFFIFNTTIKHENKNIYKNFSKHAAYLNIAFK